MYICRLWMVPLQMGLFYTGETALIAKVIFFFDVFVCNNGKRPAHFWARAFEHDWLF